LFKWVDEGKLVPCTPEAFAFADVKAAMLAKWESRFLGGCVLHPEV
jgi:hypothetical protein